MEQFGTLFDCWMVINYSVEHEKAKSPPGLGKFFLSDPASISTTQTQPISNSNPNPGSSIRISSSGYPKPVLHFFVNIWVNFLC